MQPCISYNARFIDFTVSEPTWSPVYDVSFVLNRKFISIGFLQIMILITQNRDSFIDLLKSQSEHGTVIDMIYRIDMVCRIVMVYRIINSLSLSLMLEWSRISSVISHKDSIFQSSLYHRCLCVSYCHTPRPPPPPLTPAPQPPPAPLLRSDLLPHSIAVIISFSELFYKHFLLHWILRQLSQINTWAM